MLFFHSEVKNLDAGLGALGFLSFILSPLSFILGSRAPLLISFFLVEREGKGTNVSMCICVYVGKIPTYIHTYILTKFSSSRKKAFDVLLNVKTRLEGNRVN